MALSTRESSRPVVGATRARQGRLGRDVFWVLLFGTLLAALGLFAAWTWRSGDLASTEPTDRSAMQNARAFNAPEPAPVIPQPYRQEGPPPAYTPQPSPNP